MVVMPSSKDGKMFFFLTSEASGSSATLFLLPPAGCQCNLLEMSFLGLVYQMQWIKMCARNTLSFSFCACVVKSQLCWHPGAGKEEGGWGKPFQVAWEEQVPPEHWFLLL